jgi:NAD(P)-dependent dehydrogenase (short-subunit alcohol dehydrogenase family)
MKDFKDKIVFVTGGASGVGLGQAQVFTAAGAKVIIADMNRQRLNEAIKAGAADYAIKLDVTDRAATAAAADEIEKVYGACPDILCLTAGVNTFGPAEASTYDDFDWVMGVCFDAVVNGLITFVPRMIKKGTGGYIAGTVSYGAFGPGPVTAPYAAAKTAMLNLLESYYVSLKPYGIGVSAICPANVKSHIYEAALNRPKEFSDTGYNVSEKTQSFLAGFHESGIEPKELGEILLKGIEDEIFLIVPYKSGTRMVELEFDRFKYYTYKGGVEELAALKATAERQEESLRLTSEREGFDVSKKSLMGNAAPPDNGGFGKARSDLDFIAAEKKA